MVRVNGVLALAALALGAACAPTVPDSGAGVGFDDYSTYAMRRAQRDAALEAQRADLVPPGTASGDLPISSEELQRAGLPASGAVTGAPLDGAGLAAAAPVTAAPAPGLAPDPAGGNAAISDEQDFQAVSSRETIESDKERLAENRRAYERIQPVALPERAGTSDTMVIDFALSTSNPVGKPVYDRGGKPSQEKFYRACARYASQDQAQEDFLRSGGPKKDSKGIDPDGDGFACFWDPTPFRLARQGAVAAPVAREVLPGQGEAGIVGAGGVLVPSTDLDKTPSGN